MRILIHVFSISRTMADSEQSTRRPKRAAKRTQKALEQEGGCEEMQTPCDDRIRDSTRRRQEVLPQWKQGDMRRNSDGGDAASSDSTRRRQEPQWKQADMWRSSDDGDAASSDRQRQEPLQSVEQHKRAILLDAIQGATSSHVSSDWARVHYTVMSINGKLSHILDHISEQAKSVSMVLTLIPKRNIYTYGLSLLDVFFSKKELRKSLLFPSMKSPKPSLCPEKVQRIIATIKRQFPTEPIDLAVFTTKANQKCRDS
ncbi:hypothetical protein EMCRGX_G015320 [Ephydatia muelleri]